MAPVKLLFFTGAPSFNTLDWTPSGLLEDFSDPFSRFIGAGSPQYVARNASGLALSPSRPTWRSIPLERQHLITGHSQDYGSQGATFFTMSAVGSFVNVLSPNTPGGLPQNSSSESAEQVLSQFYEESYAKHNDVLSSQLAALSDTGSFSRASENSWDTSGSSTGFQPEEVPRIEDIPSSGNLSDLKDIPSASYLNSIQPQTMTVNIVVGIISVQSPRAVRTRRGTGVELIEVLVGDETRSGFGISFWIPGSQAVSGDMKDVLTGLRPQDVVLMRNIALNSFRGRVYGQSLRRDLTKVHLLHRTRVDRTDPGGCYSAADLASVGKFELQISKQLEKTANTRQWCLKFVRAGGVSIDGDNRPSVATKDTLPPDTQ
jgi:hypothetical protein